MHNRYVGDVGDYGKFALLRQLTGDPRQPLRLGIHWYLFPNEMHNGDGGHIKYLAREDYRRLDPCLHAILHDPVHRNSRSVAQLAVSGLFPPDTLYFADEYPRGLLAPEIEVKSVPKTAPKAGKYVYWDELRAFWDAGQSLVFYHHLNRTMSVRSASIGRYCTRMRSGCTMVRPGSGEPPRWMMLR